MRRADRFFAPYREFVMRLEITNYGPGREAGRPEETGTFEVLVRGSDDALVRYLRPQRDAGRLLLMTQDAFWFYVPGTRRPIRITPIQRLMGGASNGDVARLSYADTYAATLEGEDAVDGVPSYRLHLAATSPAATYQAITYWVSRADFRPLRAEIFLASGKPYKGVRYESIQPVDGREVVTTIRILDHLRDDRVTVMRYADFRAEKLPDRLFNKNYLASQ